MSFPCIRHLQALLLTLLLVPYPVYGLVDRIAQRERVRSLFYHSYNNYMAHAFPYDELRPLTCDGVDSWGSHAVTLIDSLDMLVVLGDHAELARGISLLEESVSFSKDFNVSLFESTIRTVGGLVSAHILATDILNSSYSGSLLGMAGDLADRMAVAFNTPTGIPFNTVNLLHGVPKGEVPISCTACVTSLVLEFGMLSVLTGNPKYIVRSRCRNSVVPPLTVCVSCCRGLPRTRWTTSGRGGPA